jgi:hypothetical protein
LLERGFGVAALSGFAYDGATAQVTAVPRVSHQTFHYFWASGTGWGTFTYNPHTERGTHFKIEVLAGTLPCGSLKISGIASSATVRGNSQIYRHKQERHGDQTIFRLEDPITLRESDYLQIEMRA